MPAFADEGQLAQRFGLVHGEPGFCVELGTGWARHDISWSGVERVKGVFDYGEWPARIDRFLQQGVNVLPILDYNPSWNPDVSPADDAARDDFANYVAHTVAQFKGKLHYWQVWNEPNLAFWKPEVNARDYAELLRRSYLAVKSVDPTAKVLGFNCSDIDLDFTEQVIRYGGLNYCDILAYQPYRIAPEVGHFEEVQALRNLVGRFGPQKPIWFTEMGWATQHLPFAEAPSLDLMAERPARRQAAFMVRYMVIIEAVGIDKVFWFSQAADGAGLEDHARNLKRLSFYAYQHLMKTLDDYGSVRELVPHGAFGRYAYLFTCPKQDVVVAWSTGGPQDIELNGSGKAREARDVLGKPIPCPSGNLVRVTSEPVYLLYDRADDALKDAASMQASPGRLWIEPGGKASLIVRAADSYGKSSRVTIDTPKKVRVSKNQISVDGTNASTAELSVSRSAMPSRYAVDVHSDHAAWKVEVNVVPHVLWTYQGASKGYLTPIELVHKNGEHQILLAAYDTPELVCLRSQGTLAWRFLDAAPLNAPPVLADLDGDGEAEIVSAMPGRQTIFAFDGTGVLRWRTNLPGESAHENPGWSWTRPVVTDGRTTGRTQILYADNHGVLTSLSRSGQPLWHRNISAKRCDKPFAVGDISGTGQQSIVMGDAGGTMFCVSDTGDPIWHVDTGAEITTVPVIGTLAKGASPSIFVANRDENLMRISNAGIVEWSVPLGGTMDLGAGIALADLDGDGTSKIVASTRNHEVLAFDADGKTLWRMETGAQIRSAPVVCDIDEDGEPEILVGSADWLLYCIGHRGDVEWTFNAGNRIDGSPLVTDVDGDGHRDIVLPVRGGKVVALSLFCGNNSKAASLPSHSK